MNSNELVARMCIGINSMGEYYHNAPDHKISEKVLYKIPETDVFYYLEDGKIWFYSGKRMDLFDLYS
jgi:hypothetical protein